MPRTKTGPGRGRTGRPLPPRIDATPEEIAEVVLGARPKRKFADQPAEREYRCGECKRPVSYPETLYADDLCKDCHPTTANHVN